MPRTDVASLCGQIRGGSTTGSLANLFGPSLTLQDLREIEREFEMAGVAATPSIAEDPSPGAVRVFQLKVEQYLSDAASPSVPNAESQTVEFKSSLWFDLDLARKQPSLALEHLKKDYLADAVLKTIAGFLNADGGELWIGMDDNGECVGLEGDCEILGMDYFDEDQYQLHLRSLIRDRFNSGKHVTSVMRTTPVQFDDHFALRVHVPRLYEVATVRLHKGDHYRLFERQGPETIEHGMESAEAFFRSWFRSNAAGQ